MAEAAKSFTLPDNFLRAWWPAIANRFGNSRFRPLEQ